MPDAIELLIAETERWRIRYRANGQQIEALACAIRAKALRDALKTFDPPPEPPNRAA